MKISFGDRVERTSDFHHVQNSRKWIERFTNAFGGPAIRGIRNRFKHQDCWNSLNFMMMHDSTRLSSVSPSNPDLSFSEPKSYLNPLKPHKIYFKSRFWWLYKAFVTRPGRTSKSQILASRGRSWRNTFYNYTNNVEKERSKRFQVIYFQQLDEEESWFSASVRASRGQSQPKNRRNNQVFPKIVRPYIKFHVAFVLCINLKMERLQKLSNVPGATMHQSFLNRGDCGRIPGDVNKALQSIQINFEKDEHGSGMRQFLAHLLVTTISRTDYFQLVWCQSFVSEHNPEKS